MSYRFVYKALDDIRRICDNRRIIRKKETTGNSQQKAKPSFLPKKVAEDPIDRESQSDWAKSLLLRELLEEQQLRMTGHPAFAQVRL
jgi:hypothetical protein